MVGTILTVVTVLGATLRSVFGTAAAFLASPLAHNITGQALNVCGGFALD